MSFPTRTFFVTLIACILGLVPAAAAPILVKALGNEGFLISSEHQSVLIDGLYHGLDGYPAPGADELELRTRARRPYHRVTLVLATHHHADHFDPELVARHLESNRSAIFVSTPQAVAALREKIDDFEPFAARVFEAAPAEGEKLPIEGAPMPLMALNLHHGRDRKPPVPNLGFLVTIGGARILHIGDTEVTPDELLPLGLPREKISVAFVPFWLLSGPGNAAAMQAVIGRTTPIVAMHLPSKDAPSSYFGKDYDLDKLTLELRKAGIVVMPTGGDLRLAGGP